MPRGERIYVEDWSAVIEDYEFMVANGESEDGALRRLGISRQTYLNAVRRENRKKAS